MRRTGQKRKTNCIGFAFEQTIPVMMGYLFLGTAFGLMLQDAGYHALWAFVISCVVYAGSMQFVLVTLLTGGASLLQTAIMTLLINGRHIFYGLSFIERFKRMGKAGFYMVFSLTDETYSLLYRVKIPEELDERRVSFWIALLNQCYWVAGSVAGSLAGQLIAFDTTGIDFSMTALFLAVVVEQWQEKQARLPIIIGLLSSLTALLLLGPERFILPSLSASVCILLILRKKRGNQPTAQQEWRR